MLTPQNLDLKAVFTPLRNASPITIGFSSDKIVPPFESPALTDMALLPILEFPDERLRIKAKPVLEVTDETRQLIDDMLETMYAAPGIGLAATQVNIPQRVLVLDLSEEKNEPLALINPELLHREGEEETEEGCLSVPGVFEKVKRAEKIKIKALNREGAIQEFEAEGLLAVCIQHEMDHLEGKLFVDLLSPLKRQLARKKARKEQRQRESGVSSSKSGSGP
jgi:peptide deformylase